MVSPARGWRRPALSRQQGFRPSADRWCGVGAGPGRYEGTLLREWSPCSWKRRQAREAAGSCLWRGQARRCRAAAAIAELRQGDRGQGTDAAGAERTRDKLPIHALGLPGPGHCPVKSCALMVHAPRGGFPVTCSQRRPLLPPPAQGPCPPAGPARPPSQPPSLPPGSGSAPAAASAPATLRSAVGHRREKVKPWLLSAASPHWSPGLAVFPGRVPTVPQQPLSPTHKHLS